MDTSVFAAGEPAAIRAALLVIASALATRAEREYDKNPNQNGPMAQPFADAAALLEAAADVVEPSEAAVDSVWLEP